MCFAQTPAKKSACSSWRTEIEVRSATHLVHPRRNAQQVLHVVSNFVCDDISLRKVTRRVELTRELVVKTEVDVNLLIARTIKGAHARVAHAAGRGDLALVDDELRFDVLPPCPFEFLRPDVLGIGKHDGDEVQESLLAGRGLVVDLLHLTAAEQRSRVDQPDLPADDADHRQHDQSLDAKHAYNDVYD